MTYIRTALLAALLIASHLHAQTSICCSVSGSGGSGNASSVTVTPAGDIAATNVQAALAEIDAEKVSISSMSIDISQYATGGTGSPDDPFTGWVGNVPIGVPGSGTISVTSHFGFSTITGVGTNFLTEAAVGQWIVSVSSSGVAAGRIFSIANNLSLVTEQWLGATLSGASYRIYTPVALHAPCSSAGGFYELPQAWQLGYPLLSLHGDGICTRFVLTGSGDGISVLGNYADHNTGSQLLTLSDFAIVGNPDTTRALVVDGISRSTFRNMYIHNATDTGVYVKDGVELYFDRVRYTGNVEKPSAPAPAQGWRFENVWAVGLNACEVDQATEGLRIVSGRNILWRGGAVEATATHGAYIESEAENILFDGVDFESNPTADVYMAGASWVRLLNLDSAGTIRFGSDGAGTFTSFSQIRGGVLNAITIDAGTSNNSLRDFTYGEAGGVITDNSAPGANEIQRAWDRTNGRFYVSPLLINGSLVIPGATSGTATLQAPAIAGTSVATLPSGTTTLVGRDTTDTLTNKTLTSPAMTGPTTNTLQTSGNVGIGKVPHANTGRALDIQVSGNHSTVLDVINSDTGANAVGVIRTTADVAQTAMRAYGSGQATSLFGVALASQSTLTAATGNGFLFGTAHAAPVIIGTNSAARITVSSAGVITMAGGIGDGSALQHARVASCTTAATANATCDTTVTWPVAFADTSYTVTATLDSPSGGVPLIVSTKTKTTTSVVVTIATLTAVASSGTINIVGMHD